mgnify:CR=1 FL=1
MSQRKRPKRAVMSPVILAGYNRFGKFFWQFGSVNAARIYLRLYGGGASPFDPIEADIYRRVRPLPARRRAGRKG